MKISVITPNFNGERFLEHTLQSVLAQRGPDIDLEYIVIDGDSRDGSNDIIRRYESELTRVVREPDTGPANAINKGLRLATGDCVAWLNSDDYYLPGALARAAATLAAAPRRALAFGRCQIVNENGREIRGAITRFKECFFPLSSRFTIQCINYISQPAMLFRRAAFEAAGPLREDLTAAWDYDFVLRLWRQGGAIRVPGSPLAAFRWHEGSISGSGFRRQFKEEWDLAANDAGRYSLQAALHLAVRAGIVGIYTLMARRRARRSRQ